MLTDGEVFDSRGHWPGHRLAIRVSGLCEERDMNDGGGGGGGGGGLVRLPNSIIINEILVKLDVETLCSAACVCRALRFSVSQALLHFSALRLPDFSPDAQTLGHILCGYTGLKTLTLNCLRLDDASLGIALGPHVQELNFFCCPLLSYQLLPSIGERCPNLRVLVLELAGQGLPEIFKRNLVRMLKGCLYLESLCLKIRGSELADSNFFHSIETYLPKSVKNLKLQPVLEQNAIRTVRALRVDRNRLKMADFSIPFTPVPSGFTLQCLSLVLDFVSDELLISIKNSLPLLVELDLEDRPSEEPLPHYDLTNCGLQSLGSCCHLTGLSLIRSRQNHPAYFKRINDMGMFLLSEGCRGLESVRLGGFSRVTDAGFASILHSCQNLKKFEVRNAFFLSDLAFHDLNRAPCSLFEVRVLSCNLITSETVKKLTSSSSLEVLDLYGCRSIADPCLSSISRLCSLTTLNLGGADVTDCGLSALGQGTSPITHLCLRGCKRVTDEGISLLLHNGGMISNTLSALDLGHMPGISDKSILTISEVGLGITELCIRYCVFVSDSSVEALATRRRFQDGSKLLRRLDLFHCTGLSVKSLGSLNRPLFRGLHWLGVGCTRLACEENAIFTEICKERPWITLCLDGCEMGCHDGWQFHRPEYN